MDAQLFGFLKEFFQCREPIYLFEFMIAKLDYFFLEKMPLDGYFIEQQNLFVGEH